MIETLRESAQVSWSYLTTNIADSSSELLAWMGMNAGATICIVALAFMVAGFSRLAFQFNKRLVKEEDKADALYERVSELGGVKKTLELVEKERKRLQEGEAEAQQMIVALRKEGDELREELTEMRDVEGREVTRLSTAMDASLQKFYKHSGTQTGELAIDTIVANLLQQVGENNDHLVDHFSGLINMLQQVVTAELGELSDKLTAMNSEIGTISILDTEPVMTDTQEDEIEDESVSSTFLDDEEDDLDLGIFDIEDGGDSELDDDRELSLLDIDEGEIGFEVEEEEIDDAFELDWEPDEESRLDLPKKEQ
ncbi:MAG: hypothetical protein ACKUBY_05900 [Candidatus Moraniibacteriota bacterium]